MKVLSCRNRIDRIDYSITGEEVKEYKIMVRELCQLLQVKYESCGSSKTLSKIGQRIAACFAYLNSLGAPELYSVNLN